MKSDLKNNAYIDGNNLHRGIKEQGWIINYFRFRRWLTEKYVITKAFIFLGYLPANQRLYAKLRRAGFILVFKSLSYEANGKAKGNCDAELVLLTIVDYYEKKFDQAVLITGDGDFSCLANYLIQRSVLKAIIVPNSKSCSYLIKRIKIPLIFLNGFRLRLAKKKRPPVRTEPHKGPFHSNN